MDNRNIEELYLKIRILWKDIKPITSDTGPRSNTAQIGADENPLNATLLGYCFEAIMGFEIQYRLFEKVNYVIGFDYRGTEVCASDRKMEYVILINDSFKEEFIKILKDTKPVLNEIFQLLAEISIEKNEFTLINQYPYFKEKLDYSQKKIEVLYQAQIALEKEDKPFISFISEAQKASEICEDMGWLPNIEWRQLTYEIEGYMELFFSCLEHLLTLLMLFSPAFDDAKEYKKEWTRGWKSKADFVFGKSEKSSEIIQKLEKYKEIYRNRNAHGFFSNETKAYIQIPKAGRYLLGIGKKYIRGFLDDCEQYITYDVFLQFREICMEFEQLVNDQYPVGMIFIQSGLPIAVDIQKRMGQVRTVKEAEEMIDREFERQNMIQNMDW